MQDYQNDAFQKNKKYNFTNNTDDNMQIIDGQVKGYKRGTKQLEKQLDLVAQKKILEQCYIRDENGKKKRDTDEKHIFRYMALEKILEELFIKLGPRASDNVCSCFFDAKEIMIYPDEQQAEIKDSWNLPVSERVKIHIRLLRELSKVDKSRL